MSPGLTAESRPRLRRGVRLVFDATRGGRVLLYPEGVLVPNQTAADVLARCDGATTVAEIAAALAEEYDGVAQDDVLDLMERLVQRRFVELATPGGTSDEPATQGGVSDEPATPGGASDEPTPGGASDKPATPGGTSDKRGGDE